MSQENVEIARRGIDAWNRGDLDEWLAGFAPEGELHTTGRVPGSGRLSGACGAGAVLGRNPGGRRGDQPFDVNDVRTSGDRVFYGRDGQGPGQAERGAG